MASSLVREHTVQFTHHKGLDYVSISTNSESFEQSKMAGPISWSVIRNTSLNDEIGAMICSIKVMKEGESLHF